MKTYIKLSLLLFFLWINSNVILAQENPLILNDFKSEDSLKTQLLKHGLDMHSMPGSDPCLRLGKPPLLRDLPFLPIDYLPADSFVKDTSLIIGTTRLAKATGDVNIFWIHGLNGTTESWAVAAKATEYGVKKDNDFVFYPRKANSYRGLASSSSNAVQLYSEDLGILSAVQDVEDYFEDELLTINRTANDFVIAHSQGGIVGREWLRQSNINQNTFNNYPHGLVTFGTPHDGAEILNNSRPELRNKVPEFINEACKSLAGAIIIPKINSNFATRLLISNNMQQKLIGLGCGLVANTIVPFALDNYHKRTTLDYYKESPYLTGYNSSSGHVQGLSEYTLNVPVVQFYGVEKSPILWKFMSSTLAAGHDKLDNNEIPFGYEEDGQLEEKVYDMINDFDAGYNYEKNESDFWNRQEVMYYALAGVNYLYGNVYLGAASTLSGIYASTRKNAAIENYHAYDKGKVWLTNANDYYLTDLVGARVSTTSLNCRVAGNIDCRDNRYNPVGSGVPPVNVGIDYNFNTTNSFCNVQPVSVAFADYHFRGHNGTEWHGPCTGNVTVIPTYKTTYWYKDNDGVVLAESAAKEIKVDKTILGVTQTFVKLPETNHDQMKNSTITKLELIKLYEGVHGEFFKIPVN
jgi:hypothetical protein